MDMCGKSGESAAMKLNVKRMDLRLPSLGHFIIAVLVSFIIYQNSQQMVQSEAQNSRLVAALTEKDWRSSPNAQQAPTSAQQEESYGPRESSGPLHKEGPYVTYGAPESNATKTPAPASPPSPAAATSPPAPPPAPPPPQQQPQPQSTAAEESPPLSELAEDPPLFTNAEAPINALPFTSANVNANFGAKPANSTGSQTPWRRAQESDKCRDGTAMQKMLAVCCADGGGHRRTEDLRFQ